jgi:hypothetical protein
MDRNWVKHPWPDRGRCLAHGVREWRLDAQAQRGIWPDGLDCLVLLHRWYRFSFLTCFGLRRLCLPGFIRRNSSFFLYCRIAIRQRRLCNRDIHGVLVHCTLPPWDSSVQWLYAQWETLGDVHETCSRSAMNTPRGELVEVPAHVSILRATIDAWVWDLGFACLSMLSPLVLWPCFPCGRCKFLVGQILEVMILTALCAVDST